MDQLKADLISFISTNILSENVELKEDTVLKDIGVDSFSIVEIVLFIERKYDRLIPDHLMVPETFSTINNLAAVVESLSSE